MDYILNGHGYGTMAQRLLANGMDVLALKPWVGNDKKSYVTRIVNGAAKAVLAANATLRKDEWIHLDERIIPAARSRLIGVADLYTNNLVYRLRNGLGKTVLQWESINDMTPAELTMDGVSRTKKDRPEFTLNSLPLPLAVKDFSFNARALAESRNTGDPLSTIAGEQAGRQVAELIENILFNGTSEYAFGGGTIYGYCDHPARNQVTLTKEWNNSSIDGEDILADVLIMKQASIDAGHFGRWMLYLPTAYDTILDEDFKDVQTKSIRSRLLEVDGIMGIKVADKLAADNVVLVQMTSNVVEIVEALPITTIEWSTEGEMIFNYKVMGIMVPRISSDSTGKSGVVHLH